MPASYDTIDKIYMTMRKHMNSKQLNAIIIDLVTIPGNKSFRETVERLWDLHRSTMKNHQHKPEYD